MKDFKIVLAGCGGMANAWVKYAQSRMDAEIVGMVDINKGNAMGMMEKYNFTCGFYTNVTEAIQATGANLVFDVTIPDVHKDIVTAALSLGCNVLGEKPMAASMGEAREMVAMANRTGRMYAVMQNRRYLKNIRAYRELVTGGTIGQAGFITADFFLGPHFGGFRDIMDSPLVLDMAIHTFDQARFIADADPVSVYCHEFNPAGSWYKGNASAICIFEFSNGSVFCYRGSWCAEGAPTSWESTWRVTGSLGTAIWDGAQAPFAEVAIPPEEQQFMNENKRIEASFTWNGEEGHVGCFNEMFAALTENRKAETDCNDNIKSMAMVFGALQSAREGRKIQLAI